MNESKIFILRLCIFAGMHSLLALPRVKLLLIGTNQSRRKMYRPLYNLLSMFLFGWSMAVYRNTPILYVVPGVWSLVMYLMQAIFLTILASCIFQTGVAEFLGLPKPDTSNHPSPRLITSGWYRVVRHPLYLFSTLFLLFNPVVTSRWLLLTLFSFTYFIIGALVEERRLLREFGEEYQRYRRQVPFLIPAPAKLCRYSATSPPTTHQP